MRLPRSSILYVDNRTSASLPGNAGDSVAARSAGAIASHCAARAPVGSTKIPRRSRSGTATRQRRARLHLGEVGYTMRRHMMLGASGGGLPPVAQVSQLFGTTNTARTDWWKEHEYVAGMETREFAGRAGRPRGCARRTRACQTKRWIPDSESGPTPPRRARIPWHRSTSGCAASAPPETTRPRSPDCRAERTIRSLHAVPIRTALLRRRLPKNQAAAVRLGHIAKELPQRRVLGHRHL